jgi:DNA polymerase-3 subunit epsilon
MLILGLDFETSGTDASNDRVWEVGLALWDVEKKRAVRQTDFLVHPDRWPSDEVWAELTPIHGIWKYMLEKYGKPDAWSLSEVDEYIMEAEAVVAHNGTEFDQLVHEAWEKRYGRAAPPIGWIDTRLDVPEPMTGPLITQCAKRGFLNPFPHQALSDVLSMLRLLSEHDVPAVVERSKLPNGYVEAVVPFELKDLAKDAGYFWNGYPNPGKKLRTTKQWLKKIKQCDLEKERGSVQFQVRPVKSSSLLL